MADPPEASAAAGPTLGSPNAGHREGPANVLRVEAFRSLETARHLAAAVDSLNAASRRPSPFGAFRYLETFLAHDEFAKAGTQPLLLAAFRGGDLAGFLPLRRRRLRPLGVPCTKIEFLVTHDVERPSMAARPEDEPLCNEAFWRHLVDREPGWSLVELMEQEGESPLLPPAWVTEHGFWLRRFENLPNSTLQLGYADSAAYYRSLGSSRRAALRHAVSRLLQAGEIEEVHSADPRALPRLLDLYLDVEARSWKAGTSAPIARHRERLAFFRDLSREGQVPALRHRFLLLDGLPIAAQMNGVFGRTEYGLEMAFDEDYRELAPGNVMVLLAITDAIAEGRGELNMLNNFARQKEHWRATVTDTWAIQVFRRRSAWSLRASLGNLRRRVVRSGPSQRDAEVNLTRPKDRCGGDGPRPARAEERARCRETLAALEREGSLVRHRRGEALLAVLPFHSAG